jgi:transposase
VDETVNGRPEPEFVAFIGIDWADQKHCWKLAVASAQATETGELKQTPEKLFHWAVALHHRFGGRPVAVALEQSSGALLYQLTQYPHLWLYPVHPATAAHYRQAFYPSGSKSDPADTGLLLELVVHHRDRLRRLAPDTPETRLLRMLVEQRRQLVDEKIRWNNRLKAALKMYFPQVLDWVDIDTMMGCDLLDRWPTLQRMQHAHPGTLRKFFRDHNSGCEPLIAERIGGIYQANPAVQDAALLEGATAIAASCVAQIRTLLASIAKLDHQIQPLAHNHPEASLFAELPGAGAALRPRLIVAFGTQRDRYANVSEMQAYSGIAPVTQSSGQTRWVWSAGHAPPSCGKRFTSLRPVPSPAPSGPASFMRLRSPLASPTTRQSELWRTNGFACCSVVGKMAAPTMNRFTYRRWPAELSV